MMQPHRALPARLPRRLSFACALALGVPGLLAALPALAQTAEAPPASAPAVAPAPAVPAAPDLLPFALRDGFGASPPRIDTAAALAALSEEAGQQAEDQLDAALATNLLAGLGRFTGLASLGQPLKAKPRAAANPFRSHAPQPGDADAAPVSLAALASQSFGRRETLAVAVNQQFASSTDYSAQIGLTHTAGPLDVQFDLSGDKTLTSAGPMALRYTSSAFVAVGPALQVGMVAKGDLGTTSAFALGSDQIAGPMAKLKLLGSRASLNAETGYTFRMRNTGEAQPGQFRMNVNFNVKL